MHFRIAVTELV